MASKKYKLLLGLLTLITATTFAQTNVRDSSVIPAKRMPQDNEFWNNNYSFPAKPRNMWEVGVGGAMLTISGDVPSVIPTIGFEAHVRKAFGYIFSLRLQYVHGSARGQHWLGAYNYGKNIAHDDNNAVNGGFASIYNANAVDGNGNRTLGTKIFYNYKTQLRDLSLQGIFTLNNIRFHKAKTGFNLYGGGGIGATLYNAQIDALNGDEPYTQWAGIADGTNDTRKTTIDALKDLQDGEYETPAENQGPRRPKIGKYTMKPSGTILAGVAFKLSKRINLALEDRHTFVKDDLLDGQRWQEQAWGDAVLTRDFDSWNALTLSLNFNLGSKAVEPLWWLNPLEYAYNELNNPKHIKLPKPTFDDADGDGVLDQLDREPNTPANCPVDTHGVTKDTDGDGVPDCKDKQLITPTECQPVDADGVGTCPPPACCSDSTRGGGGDDACASMDYPSLSFKAGSASLSADSKSLLSSVAGKLKASPTCTISITGYPGASKAAQAVCSKRNDAIKAYLVETLGISADRVTFDCSVDGGDVNTVDIKAN
ncbi:MAG: OmpA family protein [Bacteroidota bacterium]